MNMLKYTAKPRKTTKGETVQIGRSGKRIYSYKPMQGISPKRLQRREYIATKVVEIINSGEDLTIAKLAKASDEKYPHNLTKLMKKPTFQELLLEKIKPEEVLDVQAKLLKQKKMEILKVDIALSDEQCREIAERQGVEVIVITKMKYNHQKWIYVSQINEKTVNDTIDMYHKLAGNYAPEKHLIANLDGKSTQEIDEELLKLEQIKNRYEKVIEIEPAPEQKHITKRTQSSKVERQTPNNKLTPKPKNNSTMSQPDGKKGVIKTEVENKNTNFDNDIDNEEELW